MNTKDTMQERICCFYANEVHLQIMILPYIASKLETNEKVYLINKDNMEKSIKNTIRKINLKETKKEEILKLNWGDKISLKDINYEENINIIINGSEDFNDKVTKELKDYSKMNIINSYNLEKISDIEKIKSQYKKTINSIGIKEFA